MAGSIHVIQNKWAHISQLQGGSSSFSKQSFCFPELAGPFCTFKKKGLLRAPGSRLPAVPQLLVGVSVGC